MYHFNYICYKMYSLVSEILKFNDHQFVSQVASTENHLSFVLAVVNRVMNKTNA